MSETVETVTHETPSAPEPAPVSDLRAALSAAYDEVAAKEGSEEASGPDRDERGRFVSHAQETTDVVDHEKPNDEGQTNEAPEPEKPVAPHPLDEIAKQYAPYYASAGLAPEQATRMLFEAHKAILTDPVAGIRSLAAQYNVDLRQFAPRTDAPPAQAAQPSDPALASVQKELADLKQFIATQQQRAVEAENAGVEQTIQAFASDPKHSHFPAVRRMMGALMQAGDAKDMETAYQMACRAHPEVWKSIQATEAEARAKAEREEKVKAASSAKAKAVQVRGAVPVPGQTLKPMSRREMLEAAYDGRLN